ncbi:MAG: hypothetical protein IJ154_04240 [Bacteroidales bacterium]|nr:hypothetical protein [Bacteroidales bacterium]
MKITSPERTYRRARFKIIALALAATALIVCLIWRLWLPSSLLPIPVTMTVEAKKGTDIELFWTDAPNQNFSPQRSMNLRTGSTDGQLTFALPAEQLLKLRIDIGYRPGQVVLKDISIGHHTVTKEDWGMIIPHDIDSVRMLGAETGAKLYSRRDDPFIAFQKPFDIHAAHSGLSGEKVFLLLIIAALLYASCWLLLSFLFRQSPRTENVLFLLLFASMILLPASHINRAETNPAENRKLAAFPQFTRQGRINRGFGRDFDTWFNDRFFLRQPLVRNYNRINRKLTSKVQNKHIVIGQKGWTFAKDDSRNGFANYQNTSVYTNEELKILADYLQATDDWCRARGKHFYFVIPPDKNKIYDEFYPRWVGKIKPESESRTNKLVDYIGRHTTVQPLYLREAVLKGKTEYDGLLYYKNDRHWTDPGAYIGYREMWKIISKDYPTDFLEVKKWNPYHQLQGDANLLFPEALSLDDVTFYEHPDLPVLFTVKEEFAGYVPKTRYLSNPQGKYAAFFLRDSFASNLVDRYFGNVLGHITMQWRYLLTQEDFKYIEDNQIDFIVLEILEGEMPKLLNALANSK